MRREGAIAFGGRKSKADSIEHHQHALSYIVSVRDLAD
jgi:hypothetical protein